MWNIFYVWRHKFIVTVLTCADSANCLETKTFLCINCTNSYMFLKVIFFFSNSSKTKLSSFTSRMCCLWFSHLTWSYRLCLHTMKSWPNTWNLSWVNYTSQTTFLDLENTQLHCKTGWDSKTTTTKKAATVCEWVEDVCADVWINFKQLCLRCGSKYVNIITGLVKKREQCDQMLCHIVYLDLKQTESPATSREGQRDSCIFSSP